MKVIRVDSYNRECVSNVLILGGLSDSTASGVAQLLNDDPNRGDEYWYKAVPENYKLFVYDPA